MTLVLFHPTRNIIGHVTFHNGDELTLWSLIDIGWEVIGEL